MHRSVLRNYYPRTITDKWNKI